MLIIIITIKTHNIHPCTSVRVTV